jgi:hypothetical protein
MIINIKKLSPPIKVFFEKLKSINWGSRIKSVRRRLADDFCGDRIAAGLN